MQLPCGLIASHDRLPHYSPETISFIANLGDTIDQQNYALKRSELALAQVMAEFTRFDGHVCTAMGNHEYYNFSRGDLKKHFGKPCVPTLPPPPARHDRL
jgi:hypothetical protein